MVYQKLDHPVRWVKSFLSADTRYCFIRNSVVCEGLEEMPRKEKPKGETKVVTIPLLLKETAHYPL
jgi:hypothetical protein